MEENIDRNKEIAIQVLKGYTYEQVGSVFGITRVRVRQITHRMLRRILPGIHRRNIRDIRNCKNRLISYIQNQ